MTVNRKELADAVVNATTNAQNTPAAPFLAQAGIVECLRVILRPTPPFRQADILYSLRALATAPGFSRESLISAIDYLAEAFTASAIASLANVPDSINTLPSIAL